MTNYTESPPTRPDLSDPIWTIAHIAAAFHVSIDRAREYTSRNDFPGARRLGESAGRLMWPRDEILAWFADLPAIPAKDRRRNQAPPPPATATKKPTYRRRSSQTASNGRAA